MPKHPSQAVDLLTTHLAKNYSYAPEIFRERSSQAALLSSTFPDTLVLETKNKDPFFAVIAAEDLHLLEAREAVTRLALDTETIGIVGVFDVGTKILNVYRRRFRDDVFDAGASLEHYRQLTKETINRNYQERSRPDLEQIFFNIHSAMRDIDGLHADEALEELCKLIYVKHFIEEQRTTPILSEHPGSVEEHAAELRAAYREAVDYDLRVYGLRVPNYKRSRGVFDEPILLSSAALSACYLHINNIVLGEIETDIKGRAFQKVLGKSVRAGMGQYFTPSSICEMMVQIVDPKISEVILDPFCGSGHFLSLSLDHVSKSHSAVKEFHEFAFSKLHGIEKSERMTRVAMTDMRLRGDGHSNIRCVDALLDFDSYPDLSPATFDVVLTNPPFGSLLGHEALRSLPPYELAEGRKRVPLEILGLERAVQFLRPNGRLGIVLPESLFSASSTSYVRNWLVDKLSIRIIVDLPNHAFAPFGANVRSGIVFGRRRIRGEHPDSREKVLMIKLEDIGYDASGRPTESSDVAACVQYACNFLSREGW